MDINIVSPINQLGYGICGLNITRALSQNHRVSLYPLGNIESPHTMYNHFINEVTQNVWTHNPHAPCLRIWHQNDMLLWLGNGLHVGYPIFELNKFTDQEQTQLNIPDKITVPSRWAANILIANNGFKHNKVRVAPLGVDTSIFNPQPTEADDVTRFLSIGKWEIRKGHDIIIKAFKEAFGDDPSVELIMNCSNPFLNAQQTIQWQKLYSGPNIKVIKQRMNTQQDVAKLMNSVDCGVFPARAEGWNLEALEMLACGKKVIATDYAGHTEFLNHDNSLLIKIDNLEDAYDGIWFKAQGQWAELGDKQITSLVNHMRLIRSIKRGGGDLVNTAGLATAKKYSWEKTGEDLIGVFNERHTD